jgi:hypothetical protein
VATPHLASWIICLVQVAGTAVVADKEAALRAAADEGAGAAAGAADACFVFRWGFGVRGWWWWAIGE